MRNVVLGLPVLLAVALSAAGCSRHADAAANGADGGPATASDAGPDRSNGGGMWGANYFPNVPLVSHEGKKVRFFDDLVKDKVVAINFIYTHCADACPMETARLLEVQKLLGDRVGKDIFFISISVDPKNDTPEVLKAYAANWKTGPGWTFYTGNDDDITELRKKLGVFDADIKKKDHNLSMIIGNQKTGRWMKRSPYENPYVLATQLGSWLHNWKLPQPTDRDYANAPEVRNISTGEEMFRARCSSCHSVGGGDHDDVETRHVGPDLFNVTKQRDRAWLLHWVMRPDEMLAEKDPLAMKLFAEYKGISMPNLRLNTVEAENLLGYIDEESQRVERNAAAARTGALNAAVAAASANAATAASTAPVGLVNDRAIAPTTEALKSYDAMREKLAADDFSGAQAQGKLVADAATRASADGGPAKQGLLDIATHARAVGAAADVAAARLAFGDLSRDMVALLVGNPNFRTGRFLFLCPMATGYQKWVQTTPTLNNPYWGKRMLTCGRELTAWAI
jgi:cytochrome oxidase Cu insertion factor (SCO1/SenC/PrrC family)